MKKIQFKSQTKIIVLSGMLTFLTLMFLFWIKGLAPFGTKSLAVMDANIQYLDFFAYYKDVLNGKNSIGYSFGKMLGGSNIAVFSYYLASPFNLLVLFFKNSQIHTFFDLVVALKLSAASMAFAFFSTRRFDRKTDQKNVTNENNASNDTVIFILAAMGYGLCQYNIAQSSNIMWLDGVYMLPLILLQVSNIVRGKKAWPMPLIVGATILFNWYSAGIDCLFSAFWFLFEFILHAIDQRESVKYQIQSFIRYAAKYVIGMITGILLSAVLFLPTIGALKNSAKGALSLKELLDVSFLGELPSAIQKYTYGAASDLGSVALFCGSLAIVLAIFTIFCNRINSRKRVLFAGLLLGSLLIFYWRPLYMAFSLLEWVGSYYYRFSYVAIFSILFLAVIGGREFTQKRQAHQILSIAVGFSAIIIVLYYCKPVNKLEYVYATAAVIVLEALIFVWIRFAKFNKHSIEKMASIVFLGIGILDLMFNTNYLIDTYSVDDVKQYQSYRESQERTIASIKAEDDSVYRISQTTTRNMNEKGLTAYYNEGLAYNYASISSYTSCPDDSSQKFLSKMGYPINGSAMCIINTSILGADSLLGVKYILSQNPITGLEKLHEKDENGKAVYLNPFAFPIAFTYDDRSYSFEDGGNPFEYQNELYKQLFGITEELYSPVQYNISHNDDEYGAKIQLKMPNPSKMVVYGSIPWRYNADSSIYVDGEFVTKYACWLSPTVFYIPNTDETAKEECEVTVESNKDNFNWDAVQFYALNLDVLRKCSEIANAHKADSISMKNGLVNVSVQNAKDGEHLFVSVPVNDGWNITLNRKTAEVELIGDCLYSIKLTEGVNNITMKYHIRYFKEGMLLTIFITICICTYIIRKYKKRTIAK